MLWREIVAAEKEHADILEDEGPERNGRTIDIGRIRRNRPAKRDKLGVDGDVRTEGHINNVVHAVGRNGSNSVNDALTAPDHVMCACVASGPFVLRRPHRRNHRRAGTTREVHGANADCAGTTLHEHDPTAHRAADMHRAMGRDAGNAEAGTLLKRHVVGQPGHQPHRDDGVCCGGAKRAVRLRAVAPDSLPKPVRRYTLAREIDDTGPVAVRDDTRERHAVAVDVEPFLDIARVDARGRDSDAHLSRGG